MEPFLSLGLRGRCECFPRHCDRGRIIQLLPETKCQKSGREKERSAPTCVSSCLQVICQCLPWWPNPSRYQSPKESGPSGSHGSASKGSDWIWQSTERINSPRALLTCHRRALVPADTMSDSRFYYEELRETFLAVIEMI